MDADVWDGGLEQVGHLGLGEPYRIVKQADLDPGFAVLGLVEHQLGGDCGCDLLFRLPAHKYGSIAGGC